MLKYLSLPLYLLGASLFFSACGTDKDKIQEDLSAKFKPSSIKKPCGPEGSYIALAVPEYWIGFCGTQQVDVHLSASCEMHDTCYDSLGKTRVECDTGFKTNLLAACTEKYSEQNCSESKKLCDAMANKYAEQVTAGGQPYFEKAQEKAKTKPPPAAASIP